MNPDLAQAILECLADYLDERYDGQTPLWLDVMVEEYADYCGAPKGPHLWDWINKEIDEYNEDVKRINKNVDNCNSIHILSTFVILDKLIGLWYNVYMRIHQH